MAQLLDLVGRPLSWGVLQARNADYWGGQLPPTELAPREESWAHQTERYREDRITRLQSDPDRLNALVEAFDVVADEVCDLSWLPRHLLPRRSPESARARRAIALALYDGPSQMTQEEIAVASRMMTGLRFPSNISRAVSNGRDEMLVNDEFARFVAAGIAVQE